MPDMSPDYTHKQFVVNLTEGEKLKIVILNPDGSEKTVVCEYAVPSGKSFAGNAIYTGSLE